MTLIIFFITKTKFDLRTKMFYMAFIVIGFGCINTYMAKAKYGFRY